MIRCDNGEKYLSNKMQNWCKTKGIKLDYTAHFTTKW